MAKYTTGSTLGVTRQQMQAVRLISDGLTTKEVARLVFDVRDDTNPAINDEKKIQKGMEKIRRWMRDPKVMEAYRAVLREAMMPAMGKASAKLVQQIDNGNDWLANKAANDVLTRFGPFVLGEEDKQITVKVEGMPELGAPQLEGDNNSDD